MDQIDLSVQRRTPALRLLLACGRLTPGPKDEATVRALLEEGIDWTSAIRTALHHGMAGMVGHTLLRVAPDQVPAEIADALRMHIEEKRRSGAASSSELQRILRALAQAGIETITIKGPMLAMRVYGDLGLRGFRDLDLLIRDQDMARAMAVLLEIGYERQMTLTPAQIKMIQYLQGQEFVYNEAAGLGAEPHTRLTSIKIALDVDYDGLWQRARPTALDGQPTRVLAPEDELIALAIHGGKELWWNLKWVCDIALFMEAHPALDWAAVCARARAQGCLRMVLLAVSLAGASFNATPPESMRRATGADRGIESLVLRIVSGWESGQPGAPPSGNRVSLDLLSLHDGLARRFRYILRTLLLPGPHHVEYVPLPRALRHAYVPIKLVHDGIALPLWIGGRRAVAQVRVVMNRLIARSPQLVRVLSSGAMRSKDIRNAQAFRRARSALAKDRENAASWRDLGDAFASMGRHQQALECYDEALVRAPDRPKVWDRRSAVLKALGREADEEPAPNPADATAWAVRAGFYFARQRFNEASAASDCALELDPSNASAQRIGINARIRACGWRHRASDLRQLLDGLRAGRALAGPIDFRCVCASERENLIAAQVWAKGYPASNLPLWSGQRYSHERIRIAYMSADFRTHVVSEAIVGCFEHHDQSRFQTTAISLADSDGSKMRQRLEASFEKFVDVAEMDDLAVARLIREQEIDILIDLSGYSGGHRTGILAHRPAPVQVNYLGFPGTMAASFMDYIIADRFIIPDENRRYYTEQVVRLPHTYMPMDDQRRLGRTPTRTEAGLPQSAFVFTCHNHERKIGPEMFAVWMHLLQSVEHSVLWLKSMDPSAVANLRHEAQAHGIEPERLIFAPWLSRRDHHLARLSLADLCLDTLPYNAHVTTCDALWAGVPLITCRGEAFPGLVASSILHSAGLPELVTSTLSEYETLARNLASNPATLAAIRTKIASVRHSAPMFDTASHTRYLESAYTQMWERQQAGLPPASFDVSAPSRSDVVERRAVAVN
jgi:predicted O-linked N-acetylglucosamine transferase (SPINDLY family)